ncbi:MAG: hypothetical protein LBN97_08105 [Oscillospiraceae bacterium]|jgi:hypothetical protein|nr:hypothetical protein [Oscillospiraceae bacterium]
MPQTIEMTGTATIATPEFISQLDSKTIAIVETVKILSQLDEEAVQLILDCARDFVPYDDEFDTFTDEDIEDCRLAREEYLRGETIPASQIDWNLKER